MTLPRKRFPAPGAVASALLEWGRDHFREFPWRRNPALYEALVAEILLRQTRAAAVAAFMPTFLRSYPHPSTLARADEQLEQLLTPLGFANQRGHQLRRLGGQLLQRDESEPPTVVELREMPGVGPYTAGMVASLFGSTEPAVDTNVARLLCRVFGVEPSGAEARKSANVWLTAAAVVEAGGDAARTTWAMLDLADAVCRPHNPQCPSCPLDALCRHAGVAAKEKGKTPGRLARLGSGRESSTPRHL